MAGGGMKRGTVYGSSDATGSEPDENPLAVEDFAMTILSPVGNRWGEETHVARVTGPSIS